MKTDIYSRTCLCVCIIEVYKIWLLFILYFASYITVIISNNSFNVFWSIRIKSYFTCKICDRYFYVGLIHSFSMLNYKPDQNNSVLKIKSWLCHALDQRFDLHLNVSYFLSFMQTCVRLSNEIVDKRGTRKLRISPGWVNTRNTHLLLKLQVKTFVIR
jgi:hypothetical protein